MKVFKRMPLNGAARYVIIIILLMSIICQCVYYKCEYNKLDAINNTLNTTIAEQLVTIENLNLELNARVSELKEKNAMLESMSKKQKKEAVAATQSSKRDFKSYMPYTAITNKSSTQYKLQQQATTDSDGIRCINSKPMVAVGTGWGVNVGDNVLITCDNGNSFEAVVGDIKANSHTMSDNKTTASNGCRCEFIVDMNRLNKSVKTLGSVSALSKYNGYVVNVVKK